MNRFQKKTQVMLIIDLILIIILLAFYRACFIDFHREKVSLSKNVSPIASDSATKYQTVFDQNYFYSLSKDIDNAQNRIDIAMYVLDSVDRRESKPGTLISKLLSASNRGVSVYVIMDKKSAGLESEASIKYNQIAYDMLTAGGCRVEWSAIPGMHAKVVSIDDNIAYIGAHNWTQAALEHNQELSIRIEGELVRKVREWIEKIQVES